MVEAALDGSAGGLLAGSAIVVLRALPWVVPDRPVGHPAFDGASSHLRCPHGSGLSHTLGTISHRSWRRGRGDVLLDFAIARSQAGLQLMWS